MFGRRSLVSVLGAAAAIFVAGCSDSAKPDPSKATPGSSGSNGTSAVAPTTGDIPVGAYLSLTGDDAEFGIDTRQGIELATDETNAAGGIKGRKVKVMYEDDKSNPTETTQKVRQLIDRNHVMALLGEVASSRSLVAGLLAQQSKIPMISPSSTNVKVTEGRDYVFRACFTDDAQGVSAADYVVQTLGKKKISILFAAQDPYSQGLADAFEAQAKKQGAEILEKRGYQKSEKNFRTLLTQLMSKKPDIIFVPNYYNDMVPLAQQAKEANIPGSMFFGGDGWDSEAILKGAGDALEGAYFTNHYAPDVPWENSKKFVAAYQDRFKKLPTSLAAQGYDAAKLLYDAMGRATEIAPTAIRDAIAQTKGFQGATGTITIDANRNADKPLVVVAIKGGKFQYAGTTNEKK